MVSCAKIVYETKKATIKNMVFLNMLIVFECKVSQKSQIQVLFEVFWRDIWKNLSLQSFYIMKRNIVISQIAAILVLLFFSACRKDPVNDAPVVGHWGCEQYVSCRVVNSLGTERWDTIPYEVGCDKGIEVFFNEDWSGKLWLNESPALIKKFNCSYSYDAEQKCKENFWWQ